MSQAINKYFFILFVIIVVGWAFVIMLISSGDEVKPQDGMTKNTVFDAANKTKEESPSKKIIYKTKPELPPLTEKEKERRSRLATALQKRWVDDKKLLVETSKDVGLSEEQIQHVTKLIDERNEKFLNLSAKKTKDNKEFEKARRRLYKECEKKFIDYLGRQVYQKLEEKVSEIFR
jgi:hypothetical protein